MPLLPCPSCDQKISVVVSQAGSEIACPQCQKIVRIPNLGDLRRLAADSDTFAATANLRGSSTASPAIARRIVFAISLGIAGLATLVGGFCLVRYMNIEVPATTQSHIAEIEAMYPQASAAQLVREWQSMEKYSLEVTAPYNYKRTAIEKQSWLNRCLASLAVLAISMLSAITCGYLDSASRKSATAKPDPTTQT
jgi:hypothetical protein